jgi:hypothetical protein
MSKNKKHANRKVRRDKRVRIRSVRRNPPDVRKLAAAVIRFAEAQAEADAAAEHARRQAARERRAERRRDDDGGQI